MLSSAQRKCEEILILLLKSYVNELKKEIFEQIIMGHQEVLYRATKSSPYYIF
jgi:hypothetical protein